MYSALRCCIANFNSPTRRNRDDRQGATADVYKGMFKGKAVAIKLFRQLEARKARREIELVFELRHPNIVGILTFCQLPRTGQVAIVFELCSEGDLRAVYQKDWFTDAIGLKILWDCARALTYMHSFPVPIVHRDFKSTNILITEKRVGKVRHGWWGFGGLLLLEAHPHPLLPLFLSLTTRSLTAGSHDAWILSLR